MNLELLDDLLVEDDPLVPVFARLREIWSAKSFEEYRGGDRIEQYLRENEHRCSGFEREVWRVYPEIYEGLEAEGGRTGIVEEVLGQEEYTLVIFDALSLREVPALLKVLEDYDATVDIDFAISEVPSETAFFASKHFGVSGPSQLTQEADKRDFAFRHLKKPDADLGFSGSDRQRVIWCPYPDEAFEMHSGSVEYGKHVIGPVQTALRNLLDSDPVLPLVVTSDHGYIWQGGNTAWGVEEDSDVKLFADQFKGGRSVTNPSAELRAREDVWTGEWKDTTYAAVRGRFAWGAKVKGAAQLFKHGGVSLMECLVPWVRVGGK